MKLVVVVGSGSGCGKTTLACRILRAIPGLGAVKISPRRGLARVELGAGPPGKDTALFAGSGAALVARLVGPRARIAPTWERVRGAFERCRAVVIEGAGGLDLPAERFVIFVGGDRWRGPRGGRNARLAATADVVVDRRAVSDPEELPGWIGAFLAARPLVLASASPRRRKLLRELGVAFRVSVPDVDERALPGERPAAHVRRLALAKARAAAHGPARRSGALWVLGADTVVVLDGEILGKPRDARDAERMLARLAGRTHEVLTGVALVPVRGLVPGGLAPVAGCRARTAVVRSRVTMKPFDRAAIRRYVAGGEPLDKAGAYAVQGRGRHLVAAVSGSLSNVVGLPIERLARLLAACGVATAPRGPDILDRRGAPAIVRRSGLQDR